MQTNENSVLAEHINRSEAQLKTLTVKPSDSHANTAVFGVLGKFDNAAKAKAWLENNLWYVQAPSALELYTKSETFNGILFAKYASTNDRDGAARKCRNAKLKNGDDNAWTKEDAPLEERIIQSTLFGVKFLMAKW